MPTREEVEELKNKWLSSPVWNIEDTEGFEEYRAELLSFRLEAETEWTSPREEERLQSIEQARKLGLEGLYDLYIKQQAQIDSLANALILLTEGQSHKAFEAIIKKKTNNK